MEQFWAAFEALQSSDLHIASTLGLLLGLSLFAGILAEAVRLPKVTAYLLVGLLVGPTLKWIPEEQIHDLDPMLKLAMALVLFSLGCHFPAARLRRVGARILPLSLGELVATFVVVMVGTLLISDSWSLAVLLACLALATAPATTVLVLQEYHSEGPVTENASVLVALNNLACIVAFEVAFLVIHVVQGKLESGVTSELLMLVRDIVGSALLGAASGLLVSYGCGLLSPGRWLALLVAATTFVLGLCEMLEVPYLLTFLVMGLVVANSSDFAGEIVSELDHFTGLLGVLFFAIHGAEMNLVAFFSVGLLGGVYILCRFAGKYAGIFVAARLSKQPPEVRKWLGATLMSQAGAAIALSTIAVGRDPDLGKQVQQIILGSVVVFEIVGPVLIRYAVLQAGEVPISEAVHHPAQTPLGQLSALWDRLRLVWGLKPDLKAAMGDSVVEDLMRTGVKAIPQSASFRQVIAWIEKSRDNTHAVVDKNGAVVGVIRYPLLSNALFDPALGSLVRAEDLATPAASLLHPDEPLSRAMELFRIDPNDCIPVVDRKENVLLGVLRRADLMRMLIRRHRAVGRHAHREQQKPTSDT